MATPNVCLFLSTGRCGTQWLASSLDRAYSDVAVVTHEPLGPWYRSREWFRSYDRIEQMLEVPLVSDHLEKVARTIESRPYVETGWPSYAAIPLFKHRFGNRLRIVHLTRHPVYTAMSYVSLMHKWTLDGWEQGEWVRFALPHPTSEGVKQQGYESRWEELSPYERALFWWTEIHLYAEEIVSLFPEMPTLKLSSEALLGRDDEPMRSLVAFLGLPERESFFDMRQTQVDAYHFPMSIDFDWRAIFSHPTTVSLAKRLGYDLDQLDESAVRDRYRDRLTVRRLANQVARRIRRGTDSVT